MSEHVEAQKGPSGKQNFANEASDSERPSSGDKDANDTQCESHT
jgi:hypothetical protein